MQPSSALVSPIPSHLTSTYATIATDLTRHYEASFHPPVWPRVAQSRHCSR